MSGEDASHTRFLHDPASGLIYDTVSGQYCAWDALAEAVVPLPPDPGVTLRLRVRESQAPGIGVGLVLVVDGSGVTIGRDRSSAGNRLRLKEMPVSKSHATIFVDFEGSEGTGAPEKASREPEPAQYYIVDVNLAPVSTVGSTHGTFVNDDRMSAAKTASKPRPLKHGDVLRIGSSVFDVHLHPPPWDVCEECKLVAGKELKTTSDPADGARGVPLEERERASTPKDSRRARLDREFREELGDLKKRLLGDTAPRPTLADGYVDRSKRRRQLHGRDRTPYAGGSRSTEPGGPSAPAASLSTPVGGKGAALLQKMGYAGGGGLGKRGDGLTEPVEAVGTRGTTGLGFSGASPANPGEEMDWREVARRKARERYQELDRSDSKP